MTNSARLLTLEKEVRQLKAVLTPARPPASPSPEKQILQIIAAIGDHHGVSRADLLKPDRRERIARIRQLCMYIAKETTAASLHTIGDAFKRGHGTVMHAKAAVQARIATEKLVASEAAFWLTEFRNQFADKT